MTLENSQVMDINQTTIGCDADFSCDAVAQQAATSALEEARRKRESLVATCAATGFFILMLLYTVPRLLHVVGWGR